MGIPVLLLSLLLLCLCHVVRAEINRAPAWSNNGATLTYNLIDLDNFAVGSYRYCKWGNLQDRSDALDIFNTDLFFTPRTQPPYSNANEDLFLADDSDTALQAYLFPNNTVWYSNAIYLPDVSIPLRLYRYLHFHNELVDAATGLPLTGNETKLIILFHGWNPKSRANGYAQYETDDAQFVSLVNELIKAVANTDWKIVKYRWEADSDTGGTLPDPIETFKSAVNGTEAAEIGHQHGQHLGQLLGTAYPDLQKVHVIAHSAGSWAARGTLRYLLQANSNVAGQITLLDPFMPNAVNVLGVGINSSLGTAVMSSLDNLGFLRLGHLENYYANDLLVFGTQETFA